MKSGGAMGAGSPIYNTTNQTVTYLAASRSLGYLNVYDYGAGLYSDILISGEGSDATVNIGGICPLSNRKLYVTGSVFLQPSVNSAYKFGPTDFELGKVDV